jgi:signal peptidase I
VGRIVAKGGDEVEITEDSRLRVNNSTVNESDIFYSTPRYGDEVAYPMTLEEDQFFILCDYRDGARDSRFFGAVDQSEIKGKVITVIRRSSL